MLAWGERMVAGFAGLDIARILFWNCLLALASSKAFNCSKVSGAFRFTPPSAVWDLLARSAVPLLRQQWTWVVQKCQGIWHLHFQRPILDLVLHTLHRRVLSRSLSWKLLLLLSTAAPHDGHVKQVGIDCCLLSCCSGPCSGAGSSIVASGLYVGCVINLLASLPSFVSQPALPLMARGLGITVST